MTFSLLKNPITYLCILRPLEYILFKKREGEDELKHYSPRRRFLAPPCAKSCLLWSWCPNPASRQVSMLTQRIRQMEVQVPGQFMCATLNVSRVERVCAYMYESIIILALRCSSWSLKSRSENVIVALQVMFASSSSVTRSFTAWKQRQNSIVSVFLQKDINVEKTSKKMNNNLL